jgi:hypothetical protein
MKREGVVKEMTIIRTVIEYGKKYRDRNTGFEGVAVAITKWQFGCIRIALQPKVKEDGTLLEASWFDEESLEGVEPIEKTTGGPTAVPKRSPDPKR